MVGVELDEQIDVAGRSEVVTKHGSERSQVRDRVAASELVEDLIVHLDPRSQLHGLHHRRWRRILMEIRGPSRLEPVQPAQVVVEYTTFGGSLAPAFEPGSQVTRTDVSTTIRSMRFAESLRSVRLAAGLTQAELGSRAGVARPNVVAYESGRREPRFDSAIELFLAAGATVMVEPAVRWTWTSGLRPFAVPNRLWRLEAPAALRSFEPGLNLWWSGPSRTFDLAHRADRCRMYEIVLREGRPADIESVVDGVLLCEAWPDLVLPRELVAAWAPLVSRSPVTTRMAS